MTLFAVGVAIKPDSYYNVNEMMPQNRRIYAIITVILIIVSSLAVITVITTEQALSVYKKDEGYDFLKDIKESAYNDISASAEIDGGGIVFFGDSITELCDVYTYYRGLGDVYNRGIVGDYTARMLHRVRGNVNALKPSVVVLLIGTNDLGRGVPVDTVASNVAEIIDILYETEGVKVVLQAVYPVNADVNAKRVGRRDNADITVLNVKLKTLAAEKECAFADCTDILSDADGKLKREYTTDGLHLKKDAYVQIARRLRPFLV